MEEGSAAGHGPRTSVVVIATLAVAAVVAGGVVAWSRWQDEDGTESAPPVPGTLPATTVEDTAGETSSNFIVQRETERGIELRVQRFEWDGGVAGPAPFPGNGNEDAGAPASSSTPATEPDNPGDLDGNGTPDVCEPSADLTAWAIDDRAILNGGAPWIDGAVNGLYPQPMWPGTDVTMFAVVVQVDPDVTLVRLVGPDGSSDEMEPVERVAALAVPVPEGLAGGGADGDPQWMEPFTVTAQRADGSALRADGRTMQQGHPAWGGPGPSRVQPGEVEPPVLEPELTLPEPGSEQPLDPAAERAAIELIFTGLYGGETDRAARLAVIDDPYGLDAVLEAIAASGVAEQAGDSSVEVLELVFTSPTEAVFEYQLSTPGIEWGTQLGRARLLDGGWKITRRTYCQDLEKAGVQCPT